MYEGTRTFLIEEEVEAATGVLAVVSGPDQGRELAFTDEVVTVGSGPHASLQIDDPTVSRIHAEVRCEEGRVRVRDLGSKNGTWLAGCRIVEAWLASGTRIRLGTTVVEARLDTATRRESVWSDDHFGPMVGRSPAARRLFARIAKVAPTEGRVLIRGESGSGKELVARAIHEASPRRDRPFVVVDGAGLGSALADDELFGHVRGAFTGAETDRAGAFERADGGTLFVDEVGDIALEVQKKLLRALESGAVQKVGGAEPVPVDVRVLVATHKPLEQMVNEGTFREDLLYRLAVIDLRLPPLRERPEDVPLIARHLLAAFAPGDTAAAEELDRALVGREGYGWPGNVRELRNFVHRVAVLGHGAASQGEVGGPPPVRVDLPYAEAKEHWLGYFERRYVERVLDEAGGVIAEAARRSGLSRVHLSNLVGRLGLRRS